MMHVMKLLKNSDMHNEEKELLFSEVFSRSEMLINSFLSEKQVVQVNLFRSTYDR
jgi:hypothetical protein